VEGSGAVQPRLAARGNRHHLYDVVAADEESSLDITFEDAEDEVINC
jgi:hypothetical protein